MLSPGGKQISQRLSPVETKERETKVLEGVKGLPEGDKVLLPEDKGLPSKVVSGGRQGCLPEGGKGWRETKVVSRRESKIVSSWRETKVFCLPEGDKGFLPEGDKGCLLEGDKGKSPGGNQTNKGCCLLEGDKCCQRLSPEGSKGCLPEGDKGCLPRRERDKGCLPEGDKGFLPEGDR